MGGSYSMIDLVVGAMFIFLIKYIHLQICIYTQIFTTVLLSLCCLNNLEMFECLTTLSAFIANVVRLPKRRIILCVG